jgi:hypothetical protein
LLAPESWQHSGWLAGSLVCAALGVWLSGVRR